MAVLLAAGALSASASSSGFHPPTQKYRDAGIKPATGRSGSATLQMRALLGMTGTDVEITTGNFDSEASAPGRLSKVQVKLFASDGRLARTDNTSAPGAGGSWTAVYPPLARGNAVQVQANVEGIDARRVDVVTVDGAIVLRPDLRAANLQHPDRARIGTVVPVAATLTEVNGDIGARADCVLSVDGAVAETMAGIWVDAGDAVTCTFAPVFDTPGVRQISVAVLGVRPGDYDPRNNAVTGEIEIEDPAIPISYSASAWDTVQENASWSESHFYAGPRSASMDRGTIHSYSETSHVRRDSGFWVRGEFGRAVTFPLTLRVRAASGAASVDETVTAASPEIVGVSGGSERRCTSRQSGATTFSVCAYHPRPGSADVSRTTIYAGRYDGAVTYYSRQWGFWYDLDGTLVWTWSYNSSRSSAFGGSPALSWSGGVAIRYEVAASGESHDVETTVPLRQFSNVDDPRPTRYEFTGVDLWYSAFADSYNRFYGAVGYVSGVDTD